MSQTDVLFLVVFLILLSSLIVFVVQFVRSRRGGTDEDRGGWWEGPWGDDPKR
ncbi:hypothetical protein AB3M89_02935 [Microbacterium sp. 179-I 3D2 NHS]|uniref:hypothetical protein n=1 Tax=Microbacterium sp. 179-I 3D2 NHS TaxID=3235178 RepID=UPI0039A28E58